MRRDPSLEQAVLRFIITNIQSTALPQLAMTDFAPNTHLVSYDVFKDISEQGNDDVVFPLRIYFSLNPVEQIVFSTLVRQIIRVEKVAVLYKSMKKKVIYQKEAQEQG